LNDIGVFKLLSLNLFRLKQAPAGRTSPEHLSNSNRVLEPSGLKCLPLKCTWEILKEKYFF
jgi:hypothetical protein